MQTISRLALSLTVAAIAFLAPAAHAQLAGDWKVQGLTGHTVHFDEVAPFQYTGTVTFPSPTGWGGRAIEPASAFVTATIKARLDMANGNNYIFEYDWSMPGRFWGGDRERVTMYDYGTGYLNVVTGNSSRFEGRWYSDAWTTGPPFFRKVSSPWILVR